MFNRVTFISRFVGLFRKNSLIMNKITGKPSKVAQNTITTPISRTTTTIKSNNLNSNEMFKVLDTPVKSASDKKEYRVIQLKNGLTVCLVCDPSPIDELSDSDSESSSDDDESMSDDESGGKPADSDSESDNESTKNEEEQKMAAAALCVGVGSFSDPKDIPGMAHFLEHMVFMGSEKYPKENDFDSFLSRRGGSDNASTDCEVTTFYFECLEKHFYKALDKFAQFFIAPLMLRNSIEREREAIESEFQMALPSDTHCKEQLLASLATKCSPVNSFSWGNLITLRDNIDEDKLYEAVHKFHKRHYSAHRMTLALQARLPMDVLQSYVLECFSEIPSNNLPPDNFKQYGNVFDTPEFKRLYYVKPAHDLRQVELRWALPSLLHKYKSKPHQYVSWLLGDEGKGSLLSFLRKKVWVLSMATGNGETGSEHNSMYALFSVNMSLTSQGLQNLDKVIEYVFSYINMLKKIGPQERIFNEIKTIDETSFRFATEETPVDFVEDLAESMQFYPPKDYLTGAELVSEYDPKGIIMVLDHLKPSKMNIMVLCDQLPDNLQYDKKEKWFGTQYTDVEIAKEWLLKWENAKIHPDFSIPPPNIYLTNNFTILPDIDHNPECPQKLITNNFGELWYRRDQKFKLPIAYYYFLLVNPKAVTTPRNSLMIDFFINLLQMEMIEEAYPAQIAELNYKLHTNDRGIVLKVSGYNEKSPILIDLITKHLVSFSDHLTPQMFEAVKDKLMKHFYNTLLKPSTLAKDVRLKILINNYHSLSEKYNEMSTVTFQEMRQFSKNYTKNLYVKSLIQGNVDEKSAKDIFNKFTKVLKSSVVTKSDYPKFQVLQLPKGHSLCRLESFNRNDSNSIVTNYYQAGTFSVGNSVIIEMIMLIIQEPLFDTLRTKEQLGYHVDCSIRDTYGILGYTITVNAQATRHTTEYVDKRIEIFIEKATGILANMSEKSFEETKKNLIKIKQVSDVHLKEEVNRNWSEIVDDDYLFERLKLEIKAIEQLKRNDIVQWWQEYSKNNNEHFRKISIQVVGFDTNIDEMDKQQEIVPKDHKFTLKLLPDRKQSKGTLVKNISEFKSSLVLHPVICKCLKKN